MKTPEIPKEFRRAKPMDMVQCRYPECTKIVRSNSLSGVCTPHHYWSTKNPKNGTPSTPKAIPKVEKPKVTPEVKPAAEPERVAIYLDTEHLNNWWTSRSMAEKGLLMQVYLDGKVSA